MKIAKITFLLLLMMLFLGGCAKQGQFDLRGEWSFRSGNEEIISLSFMGFVEKGAVVDPNIPEGGAGEYTVEGEQVEFEYISTLIGGRSCRFSGRFDSEDTLSGEMEFVAPNPPFEWTVTVEGLRL